MQINNSLPNLRRVFQISNFKSQYIIRLITRRYTATLISQDYTPTSHPTFILHQFPDHPYLYPCTDRFSIYNGIYPT